MKIVTGYLPIKMAWTGILPCLVKDVFRSILYYNAWKGEWKLELTDVYRISDGVILEIVEDAYLLMLDSDETGKGIYIANVAVDIFDLCDGNHSIKDVVNTIMNEYDIDFDSCVKDVKSCIADLVLQGVLIQV